MRKLMDKGKSKKKKEKAKKTHQPFTISHEPRKDEISLIIRNDKKRRMSKNH
jgi:hypothetical protein